MCLMSTPSFLLFASILVFNNDMVSAAVVPSQQASAAQASTAEKAAAKAQLGDDQLLGDIYKPLNETGPGFVNRNDYLVQAAIQVPLYEDVLTDAFREKLRQRWIRVCESAFDRQRNRHLGRADSAAIILGQGTTNTDPNSKAPVDVTIVNVERNPARSTRVLLTMMVLFEGAPVLSKVVVDDLKLLSLAETSALIGYSVEEIAVYSENDQEGTRYWIIGAVIGGTLGILLCGWCLLFAYYNTCGRPIYVHSSDGRREVTKGEWRPSSSGGIVISPADGKALDKRPGDRGIRFQDGGNRRQEILAHKIYLKEEPAQTDLTGGMIDQQGLDYVGLGNYEERVASREQRHLQRTRSAKQISDGGEIKRMTSDRSEAKRSSSADGTELKSALRSASNRISQARQGNKDSSISEATETPKELRRSTSPATAPTEGSKLGSARRDEVLVQQFPWTSHFAGDQVERYFHLGRQSAGADSEQPRPGSALDHISSGNVMSFHSRELTGGSTNYSKQSAKDAYIRETIMHSLNHIL